jgi:cation diffusion facilitator family transporter
MKDRSRYAILAALAANVGVAASKLVAFLFTHSSAMLAETIHSAADSLNELLLLAGRRAAKQEPSDEHPFGYARERYVFSFVVAIILFFGSGVLAVWRGVAKLGDPKPVDHWMWAIVVLVVAAGLEGMSLRAAKKRSGAPLPNIVRDSKTPELVVVLLEDLGALIGLALALIGVVASVVTGNGLWDGLATCAIGVLMVGISLVLAAKTRSLLIGEAAHEPVTDAIERALVDGSEITAVDHLRTQHLGPDHLLVAARVVVDPDATAAAITHAVDAAKERVRARVPYDCMIYLEPHL